MTQKEKAVELVTKYWEYLRADLMYAEDSKEDAIQCALIAVDEILQCAATEPSDTDWDDCGATAQYYWPQKKEDAGKFWGEVKQELEKLK